MQQSRNEWVKAQAVAQWTCIPGTVELEDEYYWEGSPNTFKYECAECKWKFRHDAYWGALYGDTCPNCKVPGHDF